MLIEVTCSELRSAANSISKANDNFRTSADNLYKYGEALTDIWEGGSRDKFVSGMEQRKAWYAEMSELVQEYVTMMNQIADKYEEMDARGAALVRGK